MFFKLLFTWPSCSFERTVKSITVELVSKNLADRRKLLQATDSIELNTEPNEARQPVNRRFVRIPVMGFSVEIAQEVGLAERHAVVAQDPIGGCRVEIHVR